MLKRIGLKLLLLLSVMALIAAACGGDDDDDATGDDAATTETDDGGEESSGDDAATDEDAAEDAGEDAAASGEPVAGGTLVYATNQSPRHLNGTVQSGLATAVPGTQVNASPLFFDENYEPQPYLAESWEIAEDGLSVTLNLRDDAVFHDGEPITSEDVAFSILTSKENHPFSAMFAPVESVDSSDPLVAVINLSQPHPAILMAMTPGLLPIIPEHIFNDGQDIQAHPRNAGSDFVGSGPFQVVEYEEGERIVLERFDDFFIDGRPYLDEIIIDILPDPNSVILGIDNGDYDMAVQPNQAAVEQFSGDDRFIVSSDGGDAIGQIDWLNLNLRTEELSSVEARQAIAIAVDQPGWRDIVALGQSTPNVTGIQNASPFYNGSATSYEERDLDRAMELLGEAGLDGGFELDMPATAGMLPTAEFVKQNLEDIGVTLNIRQVPDFPTWAAEVAGGTYDVAYTQVWNWGDPVIGVNRSYDCENRIDPPGVIWSNNSWYCNEDVDALLDEAAVTFDTDERASLYFEASELINQDAPIVYLGKPEVFQIRTTAVQNPPVGIWGVMSPWTDVWLSE
ncbi:MAG: ABC transporter substrate-binding protein [Actinomycetota bacterium]